MQKKKLLKMHSEFQNMFLLVTEECTSLISMHLFLAFLVSTNEITHPPSYLFKHVFLKFDSLNQIVVIALLRKKVLS